MKTDRSKNLIAKLNRIKEELEFLARPESKATFLKDLNDLIVVLDRLRLGLTNPSLHERAVAIQRPLEQVIDFLEFAKSDQALSTLLSAAQKTGTPKAKREALQIPSDLTNEQIRALLGKSLSKAELQAIAAQRAISVGKSNTEELKQRILKNLERQEGYERLATP